MGRKRNVRPALPGLSVEYIHDKPCAIAGLVSYRYRGRYGWIMIGARDHADALREASRSTGCRSDIVYLEVWDADTERYLPAED